MSDPNRFPCLTPIGSGEATIFVYDASGKQIAEYSNQVLPVEDAKVAYLTADHLGSPRINTDRDGNVTARHDYHPFGEEITGESADPNSYRKQGLGYDLDSIRKRFTQYEKDDETNLEFAQARYYASFLGRFASADPALGSVKFGNPQSINRYAYSYNNPFTFVDRDGKEPVVVGNWRDLTSDQRRLFTSYVENNFSGDFGEDQSAEEYAEQLWNDTLDAGNGHGNSPVSVEQLQVFVGVTHMLESGPRGNVIEEVKSITEITADSGGKGSDFNVRAELKNNTTSVAAMKKVFNNNIKGKGHGEYSESSREQAFLGEPNAQMSRVPGTARVEFDEDYRCLFCKGHLGKENSDISKDYPSGDNSHYRKWEDRYGPTKALTPLYKTFAEYKNSK